MAAKIALPIKSHSFVKLELALLPYITILVYVNELLHKNNLFPFFSGSLCAKSRYLPAVFFVCVISIV